MISYKEVEHLAELARIGMTEKEKRELQKDLERILEYVSVIQKVSADIEMVLPEHRNVMREDGIPHEPGIYSEAILSQAPDRKENYIRVKKVLKEGR